MATIMATHPAPVAGDANNTTDQDLLLGLTELTRLLAGINSRLVVLPRRRSYRMLYLKVVLLLAVASSSSLLLWYVYAPVL